jgi:hypothetical protein
MSHNRNLCRSDAYSHNFLNKIAFNWITFFTLIQVSSFLFYGLSRLSSLIVLSGLVSANRFIRYDYCVPSDDLNLCGDVQFWTAFSLEIKVKECTAEMKKIDNQLRKRMTIPIQRSHKMNMLVWIPRPGKMLAAFSGAWGLGL